MKTVYLGLGSNLGDRAANLTAALERLQSDELRLLRASAIYETEPVGFAEQPWFLNQVAEFETSLLPMRLLRRTQRVERDLKRVRGARNGPRTIDIDILFYGSAVVNTAELDIPHPRFRERRFVLEPLAELNPELKDPVSDRSVRQLLRDSAKQGVRLY